MTELKVGSVVYCTAGKEKGLLFAVVGVSDNMLKISDGRTRRLNKPKTKSAKHADFTGIVLDESCFRSNQYLRRSLNTAAEHWRS